MTARNVSNRSRCANPSWGHRRVVVRCGLPLRRLHALRALLDLADQLCDQLDLVGLRSSSARSRRLRASLFAWLLDGADPETVKGWRREVLRPVITSSLGRPVGGTAALFLQCGPDARLQPDSVVQGLGVRSRTGREGTLARGRRGRGSFRGLISLKSGYRDESVIKDAFIAVFCKEMQLSRDF